MEYGTHTSQRHMAAGAARPSVSFQARPWSIGAGNGEIAAAKRCTPVVSTTFDLTNHRQPEEAPL